MKFMEQHRNKIIILLSTVIVVFFLVFIEKKYTSRKISNSKEKLVVALDTHIQSGDPRLIGGDAESQYLEELMFLPLVSFDERGNIQNILAQSIEATSDRSWKIKIKNNVRFADGTKLTASDVEATYNEIMNPPQKFPASPRKSAFQKVVFFKAVSPDELRIKLAEPDASFVNNLVVGTLPKAVVFSANPNEVNGKGYESGPYLLEKSSDTEWILTKNKKYLGFAEPKMKTIEFRIIPDSTTRYAALIKGDIDIIQNGIDFDKVYLIEKTMQDKFKILKGTKLATTSLAFNFRNPTLSNLKVRKAIAYAVDRESILKYRMRSNESPATEMFPPGNNYYTKGIPEIPYAPQVAQELLKQSGIPLPINLSLKVSSNNKSNVEIAKVIADNLRNVGIDLKIEVLENSVFQDQIKKGISQIWMSSWIGFKDPDHLRFVFATNMVPPKGGNRGAFSDPKLDILLEEGRKESHFTDRKLIYDKAQQILSQELPYVYLWHGLNVAVVAKNIDGFKIYADGRYLSLVNVTKK